MTGEFATDVSDASGMLLLDVARRNWSKRLLSKLELDADLLARCYESEEVTGQLTSDQLCDSVVQDAVMGTRIDETNISEIVKASETLAELVRRTRDLLNAAGFSTNGDQVVSVLASDLSDQVIDGIGGNNADRRTAAVSTIVGT